jgi:hypothetical protein
MGLAGDVAAGEGGVVVWWYGLAGDVAADEGGVMVWLGPSRRVRWEPV